MSRNPALPNLFYAQSGGMTAVINATGAAVALTARHQHADRIGRVYAGVNGIMGALQEELLDVSRESEAALRALRHTPGGAFGSSRFALGTPTTHPQHYARIIDVFRAHNIRWFLYNGGGGSAGTSLHVANAARAAGYPLSVIHLPKTVDNDLAHTDFSPGFGSVAKYTAVCAREAALDVASMCRTSTQVFVMEVMGVTPDGLRRPVRWHRKTGQERRTLCCSLRSRLMRPGFWQRSKRRWRAWVIAWSSQRKAWPSIIRKY
jgi:6-phosphofructokinase